MFLLISRYIMTFSDKVNILRRQELDAFIVQAFSPELMNAQYLQDLQVVLSTIYVRIILFFI
jgi:FAD synthase